MTQGPDTLTPMRRRAVDRLLIQYLELSEREQPAWLDQTHQRLPRLGRWLAQLIDDSHTVTLLNESVRRVAGESMDRMEVSAARLAEGDRLGPWEVIEEVGRGGMGRVYRGRRADGAFDMDVAIKQIGQRRRGLAELLQRECRLLAKLDHPSVTRLVDAGLDDRAGPFLVMEWIEGKDLSDWLAANDPDLDTRLKLFMDIAEAVAHAHQRLIVHGDIKPGNVRVRDNGAVKLMDFGVARVLDADEPDTRLRALTPPFAAPEQLEGAQITPQSDLWSLGALFYWILTGAVIPQQFDSTEDSIDAAGHSRADELAAIVIRACHSEPGERYESARKLVDDIHRFKRHEPLEAQSVSALKRGWKFIRRNPLPVGSATMTFLALVIGLTVSVSMYLNAREAREHAMLERDRAEQNARDLAQVADFQNQQLAGLNARAMGEVIRAGLTDQMLAPPGSDSPAANLPPEVSQALERVSFTELALDTLDQHLFRTTLESIDSEFIDQPVLRARLLQTMVEITQRLGLLELAGQAQKLALDLRREHLGDRHPDTLASMHGMGRVLYKKADTNAALEVLREALDGRRQALGDTDPATLSTIYLIGIAKHQVGNLDGAMAHYLETLEGRKAVLGPDHPATLMSLNAVGVMHRFRGNFEQAMEYQSRALEGFRTVLGEDHHDTLAAHTGMGYLLAGMGDIEGSLAYFQESLAGRRRAQGDRHPLTLYSLSDVGATLMLLGRLDEARPYLEQALSSRRELLGPDHGHTIFSVRFMGMFHQRTGNYQQAEDYFREVLQWRLDHIGEESTNTLRSMIELAEVLTQLGQYDQALEWTERAARGFDSALGPDHAQTTSAREKLATLRESADLH